MVYACPNCRAIAPSLADYAQHLYDCNADPFAGVRGDGIPGVYGQCIRWGVFCVAGSLVVAYVVAASGLAAHSANISQLFDTAGVVCSRTANVIEAVDGALTQIAALAPAEHPEVPQHDAFARFLRGAASIFKGVAQAVEIAGRVMEEITLPPPVAPEQ